MVVDAWWFALLFAVPSVLDPTPVEFGMRSLAFSGNYWLACCAFAGVRLRLALLPASGDERSQDGVAASSVLPALP